MKQAVECKVMAKVLRLLVLFFFISFAPCSAAKTSRLDVEALMQLKASIDPSTLHASSCLGTWDFTADPCNSIPTSFVCGIRCDEQLDESVVELQQRQFHHRVTSIVLDGYGYKGTLSPYVGNLSALQVLDVSGNQLSGQLPSSLGNLHSLVRLDLTGNQFSGPVPASVGQLSSLEHLGLARNQLTGNIPDSIASLSRLQHLYLYSNQLSGPLPLAMTSMLNLLYLDASNNQLTGPVQGRIPLSLLQVALRDNKLVGPIPTNLRDVASLEVLDLSKNALSGGVGDSVFLHPTLQQVNLAENRLGWIESPSLSASVWILSSRLVALDASHNMLRGTLPPFLAAFPRLSSLSLAGNSLGGMIPLAYAIKAVESAVGIQPLRRLFLDQNMLVGSLPPPFLTWSLNSAAAISANFANNCLDSCPLRLPFCGNQRPALQCSSSAP